MPGPEWSQRDVRLLTIYLEQGFTPDKIQIGSRSVAAIRGKAARLKLIGDGVSRRPWSVENEQKLKQLASSLAFTEERERRQIASALHDSVSQVLAGCNLRLGRIGDQVPEHAREVLHQVIGLLQEAITETRSLTYDLCPPSLYELGLSAAQMQQVFQKSLDQFRQDD